MALATAIEWEVRTTGSDTQCGGGFKAGASGTDYSQQDAAQFSGTDLVVDASVNTKVTSASHNFVAADVGNIIRITAGSGWTVGFYEIVSVASNAATLDRSPAATGTTGGTWWEGGALASPGQAAGAVAAGNSVWIKAGTYSIGSGTANTAGNKVALAVSGTYGSNSWWRGYNTARWTKTAGPTSSDLANKPVIQMGGAHAITMFSSENTRFVRLANLDLSGNGVTTGGYYLWKGGYDGARAYWCTFRDTSTSGNNFCIGPPTGGPLVNLYYCKISGNAYGTLGVAVIATGCRFTGNTNALYSSGAPSHHFTNCIFDANSLGVFGYNSGATFDNCIFYGNTAGGLSINQAGNDTNVLLRNCILYGNTGYGITADFGTNGVILENCAMGSNSSGNLSANVVDPIQRGGVTLTANPFTNAAGGDFTLNNTAGGGAACRAAGLGTVGALSATGYPDIGAYQHQDSGGGGTAGARLVGPSALVSPARAAA